MGVDANLKNLKRLSKRHDAAVKKGIDWRAAHTGGVQNKTLALHTMPCLCVCVCVFVCVRVCVCLDVWV